jgi:hypothetical protein
LENHIFIFQKALVGKGYRKKSAKNHSIHTTSPIHHLEVFLLY